MALVVVALFLTALSATFVVPVRARAADSTVQMAGTVFAPPVITIETGSKVTWQNKEATNYPLLMGVHNIISDDGAFPTSPPINPGEAWSYIFFKPGTFNYHCGVHPNQMKGTVTVTGSAKQEPPAANAAAKTASTNAGNSSGGGQGGVKRRVELTVAEKEFPVLGVPMKFWTYNGTVPGTTIRANMGDDLEIVLHNPNNVPHAIHTHFEDYPIGNDGSSMTAPLPVVPHQEDDVLGTAGGLVPGLSQEPGPKAGVNPIGPYDPRGDRDVAGAGKTITYKYHLEDAGVSWYHCHVFEATDHIEKGLFGFIIVYPKGWTWKELPPDPRNGNTKAWVTNELGERLFEDIIIISERQVEVGVTGPNESLVGLLANGGVAGGISLANGRAWNDPYIVGPVRSGQKILLHVGNIGESLHSWHLHGHHWWRMEMFDHQGEYHEPGWFTRPLEYRHNLGLAPGDIAPTLITAEQPGYWFEHDHVVPQAYLGFVPWLHVLPADPTQVGPKKVDVKMVEPKSDDPNSWGYVPNDIEVQSGDTVAWTNTGTQDHSVTSDDDSPSKFDSAIVKSGQSWTRVFSQPGTYGYHCTQHPWMKGSVYVPGGQAKKPASASTSGSSSSGSSSSGSSSSGSSSSGSSASGASAGSADAGVATPAPAAGAAQPAVAAPKPVTETVKMVEEKQEDPLGWKFAPNDLTVRQGDSVEWKNTGKQVHQVASPADPKVIDSGNVDPGKSWKYTFGKLGTYPYVCTVHPWMKGQVKVVARPAAAPVGAPGGAVTVSAEQAAAAPSADGSAGGTATTVAPSAGNAAAQAIGAIGESGGGAPLAVVVLLLLVGTGIVVVAANRAFRGSVG